MRLHRHSSNRDHDDCIVDTLCHTWSEQHGLAFHRSGLGQAWQRIALLPGLRTAHASAAVRAFQSDELRFTPIKHRALPQFLLGTLLSTPTLQQHLAHPVFMLEPALPNGDALLVLPGNRRLRLLDFGTQRARSVMKQGYPASPILTELRLRTLAPTAVQAGLLLPILQSRSEQAMAWLEEPLVDGWSLPRCPPWTRPARAEHTLLQRLAQWQQDQQASIEHAHSYATTLADSLDQRAIPAWLQPALQTLPQLRREASELGELRCVMSHGDLQPGNIMVRRPRRPWQQADEALCIDWEYAATRFDGYDLLCYGLRARYGGALLSRVRAYVDDGPSGAAWRGVRGLLPDSSRTWRRAASALFVLEELAWHSRDAATRAQTAPAPESA
jgi:hypothetical protein